LRRLAVSADVNLSSVIGVISGILVLGEAITAATIVGGVLVLAGVLISSRRSAA
jgi:drug/metabolite transporter (DMT)-like permease